MHVDLAPDPSAVRTHLATVAGVACGTSLRSACGGAKETPVLCSLVILPEGRFALKAPQDDSTKRMFPMLRRRNLWCPDRRHG